MHRIVLHHVYDLRHTHTLHYNMCNIGLTYTFYQTFFQDGLTASARGDGAFCANSPARAVESELGVRGLARYWDPAGLADGGSTENFAGRRQTELKHGRVSTLATALLAGPS